MGHQRIAVIGAGIAGLACARQLAGADARVTVFERSQGLGGRLATRRHDGLAYDHGAQYLTARSSAFVRYMGVAMRAGAAAIWRPSVLEDERTWEAPFDDWHVGTPGMSAIVRPLARGIELRTGIAVHELVRGPAGWELKTDAGRLRQGFDAVVVAVPAPHALTLLGPHGRAFRHLTDVRMAPCWAVMVTFDEPVEAGAQACRWTRGPITWAACNSSKEQRAIAPHSWVAHASAGWSREHLEADATEVAGLLLHELASVLGRRLPPPVHLQAHRWRNAFVEQALGLPCLMDEEIGAGACGDWCIAPRVEAAFESGRALAHSVLSMVGLAAPVVRG
jgi:predicted NAD/FAD-dependent oxidoreductase